MAGLNSHKLNSALVGAGMTSPWRRAAASIVCAVVGTCRAAMTYQRIVATRVVSVVGSAAMTRRVTEAVTGVASVIGTVAARALIKQLVVIREYLRALVTADASAIYSGKANQTAEVVGGAVVRVYHHVYVAITQVCGINGATSGIALTSRATSERRIYIPASNRTIQVGASDDAIGV